VIFPHKDRVFTLNMSDFLIDGFSRSCYVSPSPQQESQIFCSSPFQGKEAGRWILIFRVSCHIRAPIIRVINIQDNALWRLIIRLDKHIHKHFGNPVKVCTCEAVFKPADGGLTGQRHLIIGQSLTGYFHDWVFPQLVAVIAILIAASNLENPLLEKFTKLMFNITGMTPVPQRVSYFAYQPYPVFNLPEKKNSSIRTDLPAFKISLILFAGNAFEKELLAVMSPKRLNKKDKQIIFLDMEASFLDQVLENILLAF